MILATRPLCNGEIYESSPEILIAMVFKIFSSLGISVTGTSAHLSSRNAFLSISGVLHVAGNRCGDPYACRIHSHKQSFRCALALIFEHPTASGGMALIN